MPTAELLAALGLVATILACLFGLSASYWLYRRGSQALNERELRHQEIIAGMKTKMSQLERQSSVSAFLSKDPDLLNDLGNSLVAALDEYSGDISTIDQIRILRVRSHIDKALFAYRVLAGC